MPNESLIELIFADFTDYNRGAIKTLVRLLSLKCYFFNTDICEI